MEMRAKEDIEQGQDITPPLLPLTFSLHDSFLDTHCSSCFSPLPFRPLHSPTSGFLYCSPRCSSLPSAATEIRLLRSATDTSDLRSALRLLSLLSPPPSPSTSPPSRLFGLLTNRDKLLSSENTDVVSKIREGTRDMAKAGDNLSNDVVWEEAALCLVMTNAVEVQDKTGRILGIAVYDQDFSWINHSCSPNACYRFLISSQTNMASFADETKMQIVPHVSDGGVETQGESGVCINSELKQGTQRYGPSIIVRNIKPINKGEEVTVAYTDLLQPKEISISNLDLSSLSSDNNFYLDEANQKLTDHIDEVISEYLSVGDPESCCKKLENMLTQGLQNDLLETNEGKLQLIYRLHDLNHLSLNAYTTLASAYKILSIDSTALYSDIRGHHWEAFDMSKRSAAYSLLLAGATHHLFRSESSLIASAANFWASTGESLLSFARRSEWNSLAKPSLPVSVSSLDKHKCSNCSLMDKYQVNSILSQGRNADFEKISSEFLDCVTNLSQKVWTFLRHGCCYLQMFKHPIDFSWLGKSSNTWNFQAHLGRFNVDSYCESEESISLRVAQFYNKEGRMKIYQLGVHCLFYGGYLANICYGESSHLTSHIKGGVLNYDF